ncbi:hypothetical protein H0H81_003700 [Sphagnurus paluster]|uniref:Uncharacterized protein n=1 Tax=Sphagnurus paluster TaxID=117069 RepID=A0A9P7GTB2_9AGAR|nr:hypothetical protein H0H81_003700 [Sphagnurus paluster]
MSTEVVERQQAIDEKTETETMASDEVAAVTASAPTEKVSPLGYHVNSVTVILLVGAGATCWDLNDVLHVEHQQNDWNWRLLYAYVYLETLSGQLFTVINHKLDRSSKA